MEGQAELEQTVATKMNINNRLLKYKTVVAKKVGSLKEESKGKSEVVKSFLKDEPISVGVNKIQKITEDLLRNESETEDENSESKFRKLTSGLGKKIKDIKEDFVDMKGESLQSLNDLKELYQAWILEKGQEVPNIFQAKYLYRPSVKICLLTRDARHSSGLSALHVSCNCPV